MPVRPARKPVEIAGARLDSLQVIGLGAHWIVFGSENDLAGVPKCILSIGSAQFLGAFGNTVFIDSIGGLKCPGVPIRFGRLSVSYLSLGSYPALCYSRGRVTRQACSALMLLNWVRLPWRFIQRP